MTQPTRLTPYVLMMSALLTWGLLPGELASGTPLRVREALRNDLPSRADYEQMERGYYEQILDAGRQLGAPAAPAADAAAVAQDGVAVNHGRLTLAVDDVREFVLKPGLVRDPPRQIPWSTNAQGLRDRAYDTAKPADTFRVALVGDSIGAGWGVADHEVFEVVLEAVWGERSRAAGGPAVEVLNFAVPGHGPGQRWSHFARIGWAFDPDLVVYEATPADVGWDERRLRGVLPRGVGFDAPVYRDVLASAGVRPGLGASAYKRLLRPLRWELLAGVYRAAVADCRARGVPAVWVLIPRVGKPIDPAERRKLTALARASGFAAVVDVSDAYDGADPGTLAVGPNDYHPNARGHARIARKLDAALRDRPELSRLRADREGADPR